MEKKLKKNFFFEIIKFLTLVMKVEHIKAKTFGVSKFQTCSGFTEKKGSSNIGIW